MSKTNFLTKFLKNISDLINNLLEKNLNKLNSENLTYLFKNNKIILTFVALFVILVSYLLLPTFYNQRDTSNFLKEDILKKFNLDLQLPENINYNFFPRPHFIVSNAFVFDNQTEVSKISELKIFISLKNLFSFKNIDVKDLIIKNANFNLNKKNYNFFIKLLNNSFNDRNLIIKNSNIFFRNSVDEVLFINKILKIKYYFDQKELKNIFYSDNKIFNIPYSMEIFFNNDRSKIYSQINLNLVKFKIDNEIIFKNNEKIGKSEFIFNKSKRIAEYKLDKNSFSFRIFDKIEESKTNYKGVLNFKPFYANLEGDLDKIDLYYLFGSNAIITQLLKTEIFNHKNIDFRLRINADNISNNVNFKNINLNSKIQEGLIDTDSTKFEWKDFANFELFESLIFVRNGELVLDGKLKININDYNKVYRFLLTPKNFRNKINQIDLDFTYNFDQKTAELKDIKIDNKINQNVNKIFNNIILKKEDLQNKIYLRNLLNRAIKSYAG